MERRKEEVGFSTPRPTISSTMPLSAALLFILSSLEHTLNFFSCITMATIDFPPAFNDHRERKAGKTLPLSLSLLPGEKSAGTRSARGAQLSDFFLCTHTTTHPHWNPNYSLPTRLTIGCSGTLSTFFFVCCFSKCSLLLS